MKRLFMTLFIGLALVACSDTNTGNTGTTNQDNTTQNETNNNSSTNNGTNNNASTNTGTNNTTDARLTYLEGLGYSDISNVNDTKYYQTYTLNNTTAMDDNIYGQWIYTWVDPNDYVDQDIDVYQYTATKDNKKYDVYLMTDRDDNIIGGYYYEPGQTMKDAKILDQKHQPRMANDFKTTWDKLFNINQSNGTDTNNMNETQQNK